MILLKNTNPLALFSNYCTCCMNYTWIKILIAVVLFIQNNWDSYGCCVIWLVFVILEALHYIVNHMFWYLKGSMLLVCAREGINPELLKYGYVMFVLRKDFCVEVCYGGTRAPFHKYRENKATLSLWRELTSAVQEQSNCNNTL